MSDETGITKREVEMRLCRLCGELGVIRYNEETSELYINKWHCYNWTKSPKTIKAIEKGIKSIKDKSFVSDIMNNLDELKNSKEMKKDTPSRVTVTDTDTDTVSDTDTDTVRDGAEKGKGQASRDDSLRLLMRLGAYDDIKELL